MLHLCYSMSMDWVRQVRGQSFQLIKTVKLHCVLQETHCTKYDEKAGKIIGMVKFIFLMVHGTAKVFLLCSLQT